jgi:hypothetical protein
MSSKALNKSARRTPMKIDRFTKILLAVIALLLAANVSTTILTPLTDRVAYADPAPSFIKVGQSYSNNSDGIFRFKVLKIGTSGWVYVVDQDRHGTNKWVNTNQLELLYEH